LPPHPLNIPYHFPKLSVAAIPVTMPLFLPLMVHLLPLLQYHIFHTPPTIQPSTILMTTFHPDLNRVNRNIGRPKKVRYKKNLMNKTGTIKLLFDAFLSSYRLIHILHRLYHVFTYIYSLLIEKDSVIIETFQLSFCVFMCAFHSEISSFFR
jgi:hypothetical protein